MATTPTYGRWNPTEVVERILDSDWVSPTPYATNLITPTSVTAVGTGSSATIGANGSVEFSACTSLSLNGVFSADYDNYMIVLLHTCSNSSDDLVFRLRASGTDNTTSQSYFSQRLSVNGTTVAGQRLNPASPNAYAYFHSGTSSLRDGCVVNMYGPYLSQATAFRSVTYTSNTSARIYDYAGTHDQSTSYDGWTFFYQASSASGIVSVYGLGN